MAAYERSLNARQTRPAVSILSLSNEKSQSVVNRQVIRTGLPNAPSVRAFDASFKQGYRTDGHSYVPRHHTIGVRALPPPIETDQEKIDIKNSMKLHQSALIDNMQINLTDPVINTVKSTTIERR